ncbi:GPH family glycoside/pentoside/hexuronide:cation symporter [Agromyces terreus]|uniref:GPH family glycoside/pentoside/hexuronide:cation symporter n=1 Tax=Agromyces terreus TaxID=424795 RepID=A0A9X2H298_9MICO|nr:glycoside-pentoside-hexuronide (GPH):cation symporter [Agromyces terreus]MCP2371841.1 GPH family glycoside/pentoside/hexuronide:cation symporter [Agromyces terreus]
MRPREKAAFTLGDIASNLTWTTISSYLLFFYTDVALISAAIAGTVMLVARLLDAVFDPIVGVLLDRTNTRWGRARPYLLFGAPVLAALTMLTFLTPGGGDDTWTIVYAAVTFLLVGLAYSAVNVPYGALMAMTTRDSGMRMKLAGWRGFGIGIGIIIVSTAFQPLVAAIGGAPDSKFGFGVTAALFAFVGLVLFLLVFLWVKERVPLTPARLERGSLGASVRALFRNGPWLAVVSFSTLAFARLGVITGGTIYYAIYVLHNPAAISIVLLAFSLSAVLGSLVTAPILRVLGQRRGILLGLVASVPLTLALIFLQDNLIAFTIVFFVANVVGGFGFVAAPALTADTVEWHEFRSTRRDEGLLFSGYSMSTKVGAALGSAFLAWGLAAIAYDPANVTDTTSNGIMWLYILLPVGITLLQIIAISTYRLEKRLPEVQAEMNRRRAAAEGTESEPGSTD